MVNRFAFAVLSLASVLAWPVVLSAAPASPAQLLFDQGVADMEAGRFEKACPAIEASHRLEPMPGTLFALAECEAQRGRIATAMRYYAEYAALYRTFTAAKKREQRERATTSDEQLRKLDGLVPRLTLRLPEGAGSDVVVERDGDVVAELSLGTAITVDPGEHVVTTQVAGGPEVEHRIGLSAGESKTLELTVKREHATAPKLVPSAAPLAVSANPWVAPPDLRPWRAVTWSAGAVGLVGLAVGAVAGVLALEQHGVMKEHCQQDGDDTWRCNPAGSIARARLATFGTVSTVGFVSGGLGAAVGVALFAVTPAVAAPQGVVRGQPGPVASPSLSFSVSGSF